MSLVFFVIVGLSKMEHIKLELHETTCTTAWRWTLDSMTVCPETNDCVKCYVYIYVFKCSYLSVIFIR